MHCLVTFVKTLGFIEVEINYYAFAIGNKIASCRKEKLVPLRSYQKLYPEQEFLVIKQYSIKEWYHPDIKFREMADSLS